MTKPLTRLLLLALLAHPARSQIYTWTPFPSATGPVARSDCAMAYDSARQRAVLFGGLHADTVTLFADTWEWDGANWLARFSQHYPSPRRNAAIACDSLRQRIVLFGGRDANGPLAETWEWDGTDWTQRFPVTSPPPLDESAMVYDTLHQRTVLFGGVSPGSNVGMTWEWNGADWTRRFPATSPLARTRHAMAYDELRQRIVLFAGIGPGGSDNDTWEWNGTTWSQHAIGATNLPFNRNAHCLVYDAHRQRVMLFGGHSSNGHLDDTWEWDGTQWTQQLPLLSPPGRSRHGMVFDAARQRTVLFGGHSGSATYADTWWRGTVGTPATATAYGTTCGPHLTPVGRPVIGGSGTIDIANCPTLIGGVSIGWSNQTFGPFPLPVTLAGIGMLGCTLLHSADVFGLPVTPQGSFSLWFTQAIPNDVNLIGRHAYLQAYVFAPGFNALGLVATQGIDWMFGDV